MPYKTNILKNINLFAILFIAGLTTVVAQQKIDGVAVVIGENIVLDSDIAKFKKELEDSTEGKSRISDCEMLEQLMLQKLLAHHAVVDSMLVSDAEVAAGVERNVQYFTQQLGSIEKVIEMYGFNDEEDLKSALFAIEKENTLIKREQESITEKVDVTPEEVRIYFKGLEDKKELPEFPAEIALAQIVLYAEPAEEEEARIVTKLMEIKKQVEDGGSFKLKAIINSDDPGVSQNGGKYTITKESPFIREFIEVAFSLDEGEISDPFKSLFGYHIIQLHTIKGNQRIASHILMQPEISDEKLKETATEVDKLRADILAGTISFEDAVKEHSEDKETKNNGGLIMNPYSGEATFDLTRMDPALYGRVNDLKKGEITPSFYDESRGGEKMFKIIVMKDRTDTHTADLIEDYVKVQQLALQKKKEETIAKWAKEKIKDTYIKLNNEHKACSFERNWKKETL